MAAALINTHMLTWARERAGFDVPEFAAKLGVSADRLMWFESGEKDITFLKAQKFAELSYIPFGYLFLQHPPEDDLPIPDLRTVDGNEPSKISPELEDTVKVMMQRRDWYREYLQIHFREKNPIVGRFSIKDGVNVIVEDMRAELDVPEHPQRGTWEHYYRDLVKRIESTGIMVMRESYVGHHTRRLSVDEFRGFAIADDMAPIIFVNHSDSLGARLFTLIHELCHIWIGQSGISDGDANTHRKEEILCNAVAAEFLVPEGEFLSLWQDDISNWEDNLGVLQAHFHVSTWTLARRALTLKKIDLPQYRSYIKDQQDAYKRRQSNGGPTYYQTKKAQLSNVFSKAVVTEALNGQMLLREAGNLLGGIKPSKIQTFAKELGI